MKKKKLKKKKIVEIDKILRNLKNKLDDDDYYEFCPNRYGYHKTQILNNYRPYMIDEYNVLGH